MQVEVESPPAVPYTEALQSHWRRYCRTRTRCLERLEAPRVRAARRELRLIEVQLAAGAGALDDGRLEPLLAKLRVVDAALGKLRDVQLQRLLLRDLAPDAAEWHLRLHLDRRERRGRRRVRRQLAGGDALVQAAVQAIAAGERAHFHFPDRVRRVCECLRQDAVVLLDAPADEPRRLHRGRVALRRYLHLAAALDSAYPPVAMPPRRILWNRAAWLGRVHDLDKLIRRLESSADKNGENAPKIAKLTGECWRRRTQILSRFLRPAALTAMRRALADGAAPFGPG